MSARRFERGPVLAAALGLAVLLSCACSAVLRIEEAHEDETIGASQTGGSASSAGQGGSGGTSSAGGSGGAGASGGAVGNGGASGASGSDSGSDSPAQTLCEEYCASIAANCSGDFQQYVDTPTCLDMCGRLPAGSLDDERVNTVHCRMRQAKLARVEPFTHCASAGPAGSGVCGANCDGFCEVMMSLCTQASAGNNENGEPNYFASKSLCVEACVLVPENPPYTSSLDQDVSRYSGDHIECRLFHLSAAVQAPDEHCTHAMGRLPCADPKN